MTFTLRDALMSVPDSTASVLTIISLCDESLGARLSSGWEDSEGILILEGILQDAKIILSDLWFYFNMVYVRLSTLFLGGGGGVSWLKVSGAFFFFVV